MITKMKKLTFLIYHKDYECFLQSVRDLGVVHVAEKAQGTAENAELQESIRLSDRYASTIKFLQGFRGMGRFRSCIGYAVARSWISSEFLYLLREEL